MLRVHSDSSTPSQTGAQATFLPFRALSNEARNSSRGSAASAVDAPVITTADRVAAAAPHSARSTRCLVLQFIAVSLVADAGVACLARGFRPVRCADTSSVALLGCFLVAGVQDRI